MSKYLELVEISDGVIVLRRSDSKESPLVKIEFSKEVKNLLNGMEFDVAKEMIKSGIETLNTDIDIESSSGALQVKGTIATGPFKGASGYTYTVYLTSQGDNDHAHTFYEYPGLTFYMPDSGGYHGSETASSEGLFKPKSHY